MKKIKRKFKDTKSKKNQKKNIIKKNNYNNLYKDTNKNNFDEENFQLEGRNPILEALNTGKQIDKIFVKKGEIEGTLKVIIAKAIERGIVVQEVEKTKIENMKKTNNCQGVIAICPAHDYCDVSDILQNAKDKNELPFIIILDEITDPHNLGAIIRTAHASGAHGVIIPKRRSATLTPIVSKTSAGSIEHIPVAKVNNISKEIEKLKKEGIWVVCADTNGTNYFKSDLKGAIAIVIGNESVGVGRLIKNSCDFSVKIPMQQTANSLNASVAGSLIMYEIVRQRNFI